MWSLLAACVSLAAVVALSAAHPRTGPSPESLARSQGPAARQPAPPIPTPLSPELQAIHACSGPTPSTYEPLALVRAVNLLRSLGKERAIACLREYVRLAPEDGPRPPCRPVADRLSTGDWGRVMLLVRLLFVPDGQPLPKDLEICIDPSGGPQAGYPVIYSGMMAGTPYDWHKDAAGYPLRLRGDLPFLVADWLKARSGYDSNPLEHLRWAESNGVLRAAPLRPTDNPIDAAEELWNSGTIPPDNDPRAQIWMALEQVVGMPAPDMRDIKTFEDGGQCYFGPRFPLDEARWQEFAAAARNARLAWNDGLQSYVARRPRR